MNIIDESNAIIELTGAPATGKSSYAKLAGVTVFKIEDLNSYKWVLPNFFIRLVIEIFVICVGMARLGPSSSWFFLKRSLAESPSLLLRLNIFRNTLRKFGVDALIRIRIFKTDIYIDEGISHIPFNFPSTEFSNLEPRLRPYLKKLQVHYLASPPESVLIERLRVRGHKRLSFMTVQELVAQNLKVEQDILLRYPSICKSFVVVQYD